MDQSTLIVIMAGAVCVSAIALVIQMFLLYTIAKVTKSTHDKVEAALPKVEGMVESARVAIEESRAGIAEVRQKSIALIDSGQQQVNHVQAFLVDASARTSSQLDHAEVIINDALNRTQETVALVHKGILKPIRGITGLAAAVTTAIQFLAKRRSTNPDRITVDEEMFI